MKKLTALVLALILALSLSASLAETQLIGIPADGTNLSRGIKLLETAGLITVDPAAGYTPEIADITDYLYDVEIIPVAADTLIGRRHQLTPFLFPSSQSRFPQPAGRRNALYFRIWTSKE